MKIKNARGEVRTMNLSRCFETLGALYLYFDSASTLAMQWRFLQNMSRAYSKMAMVTKAMLERFHFDIAIAWFGDRVTCEFSMLTKHINSANKRPMRPGIASTGRR